MITIQANLVANQDPGLETLLELDGEFFPMDDGHWVKIEAQKTTPDSQIPHGIKYSLTLHDKHNNRVIGFDNAHGIKPRKKRFSSRKITWDHKHYRETVRNYEFESPGQLLEDFWKEVDKFLKDK